MKINKITLSATALLDLASLNLTDEQRKKASNHSFYPMKPTILLVTALGITSGHHL